MRFAHHDFSACPPKAHRIAESTRFWKSASPRERSARRARPPALERARHRRWLRPSSIAPRRSRRLDPQKRRAIRTRRERCAVRSSSHELITLPCRHTSAIGGGRSRSGSAPSDGAGWSPRRVATTLLPTFACFRTLNPPHRRPSGRTRSVVNHLHEVTGADGARSGGSRAPWSTARGRRCADDPAGSKRRTSDRAVRRRRVTADHQAEAALESPHAAAGPMST